MKHKVTSPYALDEYFASGFEETENPFITETSRRWGRHVSLIGASAAALFLLISYILHFFTPILASFFLVLVYFLAGTPALIHSLKNVFALNINIQVLMTTAALLSVLIGSELEGGLLLVLFSLSEALEDSVTKKTKGALNSLHKLSPSIAHVIEANGTIYPKSVKEVELETKILVKAGEIIPLDGIVVDGNSFINNSHLTGESVPIAKAVGDEVQAGSLNTDGTLTVVVKKRSRDSTLAKIINLITEAHEAKPKIQKMLDRFGRTYATTVIILAICFASLLPVFFSITYLSNEGSIYRALAFLIAASPCALIIATPTAYLAAISSCAKKGILLKGGIILDALAKCKLLSFDKTGTLTTGNLSCVDVEVIGNDISTKEGLSIAAGLERAVVHPIANAILAYVKSAGEREAPIEDLKVLPGRGVEGYIKDGEKHSYVVMGSTDFILNQLKDQEQVGSIETKIKRSGHVISLLKIKNTVVLFHFLDEIRPQMKEVVASLKEDLNIAMLTGDHKDNAVQVAEEVGISEVYANLQPEDKLRIVQKLAKHSPLIMVGDGINDAPALSQAMVGIAMGEVGSATAVEAADVVLLRDDLKTIGWLVKRAKKTVSIVRQNLSIALFVILCATVLSLIGIIPLWLAVILHEGSTVVVGLNSLRLLK